LSSSAPTPVEATTVLSASAGDGTSVLT